MENTFTYAYFMGDEKKSIALDFGSSNPHKGEKHSFMIHEDNPALPEPNWMYNAFHTLKELVGKKFESLNAFVVALEGVGFKKAADIGYYEF